MAGSANTPAVPAPKPKRLSAVAWRDILIANGFVSLLFGVAALFVAGRYSVRAQQWVQESSPDEFVRVIRVAVLVYILYALVMLGAGMAWLTVSVYAASRHAKSSPPVNSPSAEPGDTDDRRQE